jgi:isopenicillin-N N-acyltransferase like protein
LNAIRAKPVDQSKLPIHVALRVCLDSKSKAEAIARLEDLGGMASAQHILIADAQGPTSWEVSPKGNVQIEPDSNGIVCHTNHMIENKLMHEPLWLSGSPIRLERIRELSKKVAVGGKYVDSDTLRSQVFSDTYNAPQAICCQEDPSRPVETRSSTLFNIIMKLGGAHPSAEVVWGQPGSGREGEVLRMPW